MLYKRADATTVVDDTSTLITFFHDSPTNQTCATTDLGAVCDNTWWIGKDSRHYGGTAHFTFGPKTTLAFVFQGDSVEVFGPSLSWTGSAKFSVDDSTPLLVNTQNTNQDQFQVPFFSKSGLDPTKSHILNVDYDTSQFGEAGARKLFGIDYITYGMPDGTPTNPSSTGSSQTSPTTPETRTPPSSSKHVDLAAIVGGVLGGFLGISLLAAVAGFYIYRRRVSRVDGPEQVPRSSEIRAWRGSLLPASLLPTPPPATPNRVQKDAAPPPYTE